MSDTTSSPPRPRPVASIAGEVVVPELDWKGLPERSQQLLLRLQGAIGVRVIGLEEPVRHLLVGLLCEGHVLMEGVPGLAKTYLVRTFAEQLDHSFRRIQFTPDMLRSDILGSMVLDPRSQELSYRPGPIFANVVLADEINRAPPKVQSALLEAMQERQVTIDGTSRELPHPFIVIATQNPVD
ncbi:MAG: AAA family ATPase [Thermoplasmata archaeon]